MDEHFSEATEYARKGDIFSFQSLVETNPGLITMTSVHNKSLLHYSIANSEYNICKFLLDKGAIVDGRDRWGRTPFYFCESRDIRFVSLFLSYGADINAADEDNQTALYRSCSENRVEYTECLLKHGADVNITGATSCLYVSIYDNNKSLFWLCIKYGSLIENDAKLVRNMKGFRIYFRDNVSFMRIGIALCSSKLVKNQKSSLRLLSGDMVRGLCSFLL
jgi:ankyrin repeat protein